jgi:hypothetical protein
MALKIHVIQKRVIVSFRNMVLAPWGFYAFNSKIIPLGILNRFRSCAQESDVVNVVLEIAASRACDAFIRIFPSPLYQLAVELYDVLNLLPKNLEWDEVCAGCQAADGLLDVKELE